MGWFATTCWVAFTVLNTVPVQRAIGRWIATTVQLGVTDIAVLAFLTGLVAVIAPVSALDP
jgi:hypothetical protein